MPVKKYDKPNKTVQCIKMIKILKAKKYIKKDEIAYLLNEPTARNINNYKNTLYDAGYPIHYKSGKNGGYYLENENKLPRPDINEEDLERLRITYDYLKNLENIPNKHLLMDVLGNYFVDENNPDKTKKLSIFGHFPLSMSVEEIDKRYYLLDLAIERKQKVRILYKGYAYDNEKIIHPYKLFRFTNWFIFAYDEKIKDGGKNKFNKFKLHRIKEIELLDENFTYPHGYDEERYFTPTGLNESSVHLELMIYGKMGRMLDEKIYGQNQVVKTIDPKKHIYYFEADMKNELVIRKFIMSFGSRCEVIEPKRIRDSMYYDAKRSIKYYERDAKKMKYFFSEQSFCNNSPYNGFRKQVEGSEQMKITGKHNEAIVFVDALEENAYNQIQSFCDLETFKESKIRVMPDVHTGKGCVIGFTANMTDKVIPNLVGVDIGCGMLTVKLGKVNINYKKLDKFIQKNIPNGKKINEHSEVDFMDSLEQLRILKYTRQELKKWNRALGSLGGGNHFIEINVDDEKNKYLVIHSGSRNLGHVVASFYQKFAVNYHSGFGVDYYNEKESLIENYKGQGRRKEIQDAIEVLKVKYHKESPLPDHFAYLEGEYKEDYLFDMQICQSFAELNRDTMANKILMFLFGHTEFERFQTVHNYIDFEDNILRKGAIKADKGREVLIPLNMRDGSILAVGKGNPEWNSSAPHGAGRLFSRTKAFESLDFNRFKKEMHGIYSTSVTPKTLDESPMAYKKMKDITKYIDETVEIKHILKPVYNFKSQN